MLSVWATLTTWLGCRKHSSALTALLCLLYCNLMLLWLAWLARCAEAFEDSGGDLIDFLDWNSQLRLDTADWRNSQLTQLSQLTLLFLNLGGHN